MTTTLAGFIAIGLILIAIGVAFVRRNLGIMILYVIAAQGLLAFLIIKGHADTVGSAVLDALGITPAPQGTAPATPPATSTGPSAPPAAGTSAAPAPAP